MQSTGLNEPVSPTASPYSNSLAHTRKALSTQITPRLLPEYVDFC